MRFGGEEGEDNAGARAEPVVGRRSWAPTIASSPASGGAPQDAGKPLVSLATEFQESLDVKLGDKLTFDIAGETFEVTIANFRKVKWDSFQPNFFIVFAPGVLEQRRRHLHDERAFRRRPGALARLARAQYPSVSIFDIQDLLDRVRSVFDKAVLAVQSVFFFTLFAGLTVMMAAVQASRDERRYESAMLRTLGASRATVLQGVLAEFIDAGVAVRAARGARARRSPATSSRRACWR